MLKNYTKIIADKDGNKRYLNDEDEEHRLDGPAVECSNGSKEWRINENRHRNIDPANEWSDGAKRWWFKGKRHRIGGSCSSYGEYWFIHHKEYTKKQYINIVWDI